MLGFEPKGLELLTPCPLFSLKYDLLIRPYNRDSRCTQRLVEKRPEIVKLFSISNSRIIEG